MVSILSGLIARSLLERISLEATITAFLERTTLELVSAISIIQRELLAITSTARLKLVTASSTRLELVTILERA